MFHYIIFKNKNQLSIYRFRKTSLTGRLAAVGEGGDPAHWASWCPRVVEDGGKVKLP